MGVLLSGEDEEESEEEKEEEKFGEHGSVD